MEAAGSGQTHVVNALLQARADINSRNNAVSWRIWRCPVCIADTGLQGGCTALMRACGGGFVETARLLVTAQADVNLKDKFNVSATL